MKLSLDLTTAGFFPRQLETGGSIVVQDGVIAELDLVLKAVVPGISEERFQQIAAGAKDTCPVSRAYTT